MKSKNAAYQEKIDHLRFVAAFWIILYHSINMYKQSVSVGSTIGLESLWAPALLTGLWQGHTAVALFMTLSGFLFATICRDKQVAIWSFYKNRLLRIYPLFFVVLLISCYLDPDKNGLTNLMTSLCFLQNLPSAVQLSNLTESLWAIAVECQFYLLFPFLLIFYRRYGYKYLFGVMAIAILVRWAAFLSNGSIQYLAYKTIFGRVDQFLIGMICGLSYSGIRASLRRPRVLIVALALAVIYLYAMNSTGLCFREGGQWIFITDCEGLIWAFLIASYCGSDFRFSAAVSRVLAFAGTLSYSLYVMHPFVLRLTPWFAGIVCHPHHRYQLTANLCATLAKLPYLGGLLFGVFLVFPVTFVVSLITYNLIERPFLELRSVYTLGNRQNLDGDTAVPVSPEMAAIDVIKAAVPAL